MVELDYSQYIGLEFIQMEILNQEVDLVSANGVSKLVKPFIDKEKQLIYAK